jgi:hypothetical protein
METRSMQSPDTAEFLTRSRSAKNTTTWKKRTTRTSKKLREVVGEKKSSSKHVFSAVADVLISTKPSTAVAEFQCNLIKRYEEINTQDVTTQLCPFLGALKVEVFCVHAM